MKAMIFAAGLGTRLKPYTDHKPKALVEVGGHPMIKLLILQLKQYGIKEIIVNVHHFADQLIEYIQKNNSFGLHIEISDESGQLLDTGGGLKKAAWFFDDNKPFLLHNVDVLSNIDFSSFARFHEQSKALATLAVCERQTSRYLVFNSRMQLVGWENRQTGQRIMIRNTVESFSFYAFSGIHIINPELLNLFTRDGCFSMIDAYLQLGSDYFINGYQHDASGWIDMGKPSDLILAAGRLDSELFTRLKADLQQDNTLK